MRSLLRSVVLAVAASLGVANLASAADSLKVADVVSAADLKAMIADAVSGLEKLVADEKAFAEADTRVRNSASVLAAYAQAASELEGASLSPEAARTLRQAAQDLAAAKEFGPAKAAFDRVVKAANGEAAAEPPAAVEWGKVARMHPSMEEMEQRATKLRRSLKRIRRPDEDAQMAASIGILGLVTYGDTHEVKDPADLPQWQAWAVELQEGMAKTAAAIREKDAAAATGHFEAALKSCEKCHEKFQD